jgi:hypothetical protein
MFIQSPYVFAGIVHFRDASQLWTGAEEQTDDAGNVTAPAQVVNSDNSDTPQLKYCRWLVDKRIKRSMKDVLEPMYINKAWSGKAVAELKWVKEKEGEYAGHVVLDDIVDVDPTLFEYDPPLMPPGLYLRRPSTYGTVGYIYELVDPRRFIVVTNHMLFNDRNGIAEIESLRKAELRREDNEKNWGRANQRAGRGSMRGIYGPSLLGAEAQSDRDEFKNELKDYDENNNTVMIMYEENGIEIDEVSIQADSFQHFADEEIEQISLVTTGSPTTLKEGIYGNQSIDETEKRQESKTEKTDSADISDAFTHQVFRRACDFNFTDTEVYPKMRIINANLIAPVTPEEQETNQEIAGDSGQAPEKEEEPKDVVKNSLPWGRVSKEKVDSIQQHIIKKFQEEEPPAPVAVPTTNEEFPRETPTPEPYANVEEEAQEWLEQQPVKRYNDVSPAEAPATFTIKRLRGWDPPERQLAILEDLHSAIIPTMTEANEADAWKSYYEEAKIIFKKYGSPMDTQIRSDLQTSFRQARQNAFFAGLIGTAESVGATGIEFENLKDGHDIRFEHKRGDGMKIALSNPLLQEAFLPWDFACLCLAKHYFGSEFTPDDEIRDILSGLGKSYRLYVV